MKIISYNSIRISHEIKLYFGLFKNKLAYINTEEIKLKQYFSLNGYKLVKDNSCGSNVSKELIEYFSGNRQSFKIDTVYLTGTPFEQRVWNELKKIPFGSTINYSQLAERIKNPKAYRAVGNANSKNPIPIIIPCHRVIKANGENGGYSMGISLKEHLLKIENPVNYSRI